MIDNIKNRLNGFGYTLLETDDFAINFILQKIINDVKHFCNIQEVPECLNNNIVDAVCSEFLQSKKSLGQLSDLQMEGIVKKIQDGDTTVEYVSGSSDSMTVFDNFINSLKLNTNSLIAHRCLKW